MKISIKKKLFFIFISITLGYVSSIFLLNFTILGDYYTSKISKRMESAANEIKVLIDEDGNFDVKEFIGNEYTAVVKTIIMKQRDNTIIYNSIVPYIGNLDAYDHEYFLNAQEFMLNNINSFCEIPQVKIKAFIQVNNKVLQLMYRFDKDGDTYYVCMMASYEQITQNILIFNKFCLMFGLIILVVFGGIFIIIIEKFTAPILHINKVSKKLATLDFSDRLNVISNDEMGLLAENINIMADKLEDTINKLIKINEKQAEDISIKEKIDESRRYFLSSVSHELKTPISLIVGYAEAIKFKDKKTPVDYYCDIIIDEGDKMNKLVSNILKVSQMDSEIMPINKINFSITELINKYLQNYEIKITENDIKVEKSFNSDDEVYADYELISQVLNNYLTNAINHASGEKIIQIFTFNNKDKVRISIFNTGNHIAEENLSKVWDSFFKEDKARTRQYGGHGFGLTVVKTVMMRHNTDYGVNNVENGVTFYFELEKYESGNENTDKKD